MTQPKLTGPAQRNACMWEFGLVALCLIAVLALLFHDAAHPDKTVFSNDGPLGNICAKWAELPSGIASVWQDLNWLGTAGASGVPNTSITFALLTGKLLFSKLFAPSAVLFAGLCAWFCFRQWKFSPVACVLGGIATTLNGDFFATACWGVASQVVGFGLFFLALAALADTTSPRRWVRVVLAGFAVGMGVMEAFDIGALFSLLVAAFVVFQALAAEGPLIRRLTEGAGRLVLVATFAGFIATAVLSTLIGTQIKGVVGMAQDAETKAARWSEATQWSTPKCEALGILVPGLFGFRMDTPDGGAYWGAVGSDPQWDVYLASDRQGPPPRGFIRYGGGGGYAGVIVVLVAAWAVAQSFRRRDSAFSLMQRRMIWFWLAALGVSLLLSFGRFAPFYQFFYALPYASTIRNPAKFLHTLEWALLILFAYGLHGLSARYMETAAATGRGLVAQWQAWWPKVTGFDRRWVLGSVGFIGLSLVAWFVYAKSRDGLEAYIGELHRLEALQRGGTADPVAAAAFAHAQVSFSLGQVGRYILFLVPGVAMLALILSGYFSGARAKIAAGLLGVLLVADLAWANVPWVITYNWKEKYLEAADNPVIEFLRQKPYEHRVSIAGPFLPAQYGLLDQVYGGEWMQHLFPYYNIQSPDVVQMPRRPVEYDAFESALLWDRRSLERATNTVHRVLRRWELMNTRYLLGAAGMAEGLNREIDPQRQRFRELMQFQFYQSRQDGPILTRTNAFDTRLPVFALMEFTGALPRAKLYGNWQVNTNDTAVLQTLAAREFDPARTVLVAGEITPPIATNANTGTVEYSSYAPKHIVLNAKAAAPAVLLLNDKYDPNWKVLVDGKPAPLLRCNYVMRGVQLAPGDHRVEFHYEPSTTALYISLAAIGLGLALLAFLAFGARQDPTQS